MFVMVAVGLTCVLWTVTVAELASNFEYRIEEILCPKRKERNITLINHSHNIQQAILLKKSSPSSKMVWNGFPYLLMSLLGSMLTSWLLTSVN